MNEREFHPEVRRLLDGEITIADLPLELRVEGEEALRLLAAVDRTPVSLPAVTWRVMAALERRRQRVRWSWLLVAGMTAYGARPPRNVSIVALQQPTALTLGARLREFRRERAEIHGGGDGDDTPAPGRRRTPLRR